FDLYIYSRLIREEDRTTMLLLVLLERTALLIPDFYNWNRVNVRYCDGSSFSGDKEEVNL
ncbi:hypothetical protein S83_004010, partial [Arachis hypogaea]